jgi:uncharacterized protein YpbB
MRIEVFKTNVVDRDKANWLINKIQNRFDHYQAGFDLEDCDRILVVKCKTGTVEPSHIINLLKSFDYNAEVLPDE